MVKKVLQPKSTRKSAPNAKERSRKKVWASKIQLGSVQVDWLDIQPAAEQVDGDQKQGQGNHASAGTWMSSFKGHERQF